MFRRDNPFSDFQWDEVKRKTNILKHGIDFEDVIIPLSGACLEQDTSTATEKRILAVCLDGHRVITVIYTMRGTSCRIISARIARAYERELYYTHDT